MRKNGGRLGLCIKGSYLTAMLEALKRYARGGS